MTLNDPLTLTQLCK